jgi:hypothetical protein
MAEIADGFRGCTGADRIEHAQLSRHTLSVRDAGLAEICATRFLEGTSTFQTVANEGGSLVGAAGPRLFCGAFDAFALEAHAFSVDVCAVGVG